MSHYYPDVNLEFINFDTDYHEEENLGVDYMGLMYINDFFAKRVGFEEEGVFNSHVDDSTPKQFNLCKPSESYSSVYISNEQPTGLSENKSVPATPVGKPFHSFKCSFDNCSKSFKYKWILERHLISHNKTKMFRCLEKGCEKSYKSKENLTLHFKNIHLKVKPYQCRFCSSIFSHRNGKTYHERKFHTHILPYTCGNEDCGMAFASKSALNYHLSSAHIEGECRNKLKNRCKSKFGQEILKFVNTYDQSSKSDQSES